LYFDFNITCYKDVEHFIFQRNNNETYIAFSIKDCNISDNNFDIFDNVQDEEIRDIIQNYYANYIKNITSIYYNDIFGES
jgi:GTPase SAR1 family protein